MLSLCTQRCYRRQYTMLQNMKTPIALSIYINVINIASRSDCIIINRGSANVLLNLLNELKKRGKIRGLSSILSLFFATSLIHSIIQEHKC